MKTNRGARNGSMLMVPQQWQTPVEWTWAGRVARLDGDGARGGARPHWRRRAARRTASGLSGPAEEVRPW
jgi:hypothetical protein